MTRRAHLAASVQVCACSPRPAMCGWIARSEIARHLEGQPGARWRAPFRERLRVGRAARRDRRGSPATRQHRADDLLIIFDLAVDVGRLEVSSRSALTLIMDAPAGQFSAFFGSRLDRPCLACATRSFRWWSSGRHRRRSVVRRRNSPPTRGTPQSREVSWLAPPPQRHPAVDEATKASFSSSGLVRSVSK